MKHMCSRDEYDDAKQCFIDEVKSLVLNDNTRTSVTISSNVIDVGADKEKDPLADFCLDSPERESLDSVGDDSCAYEECVVAVRREIENYLDPSISVPPKTDPLQWWKVNGSRFPKVAMAARKWLCVPGTSTPSERVFSHCGIALSAKRSSMRGEALMNQVLLKNNLRHVLYTVEDINTFVEVMVKGLELATVNKLQKERGL